MVVFRAPDARVCMLVPDGLEAREGINEDTDSFVALKCLESRVYGDEFCPHNGAGLFSPRCVYIYSGGRWYVDHRRPKPREAVNVGSVCVYPVFWDELWCPRVRGWWGAYPVGRECSGNP